MKFSAFLLVLSALVVAGCQKSNPTSEATPTANSAAPTPGPVQTAAATAKLTKLKSEDIKVGEGNGFKYSTEPIADGDEVFVRYEGKLANGTVFDSNMDPKKDLFQFVVGEGSVIAGWDQGVPGMKVGGMRKLSIPSDLAYGSEQKGNIPPDSDLYFTIKILDVVKKGDGAAVYKIDKKIGTGPGLHDGAKVTVRYTAENVNGKTVDKQDALSFKWGNREVTPAIEVGMKDMKVGGVRMLHIGPVYSVPNKNVPANTPETFTIELLKVE